MMVEPERSIASRAVPLPSKTSTRAGSELGENVHVEAAFASAGGAVIAAPLTTAASARRPRVDEDLMMTASPY